MNRKPQQEKEISPDTPAQEPQPQRPVPLEPSKLHSVTRVHPTSIAEGPAFAREVMQRDVSASEADNERFDQLAQNDPGYVRRWLASAEQKVAWELQTARIKAVGKDRLARINLANETQLRVLAIVSDAFVKAAQIGIARSFFDSARGELNHMARDTEKHRLDFIAHVARREATLLTLSMRIRPRYEASLNREIDDYMDWFDGATSDLISRLKDSVITYAGTIDR